ncbi:MAG: hypothetical protein ACTHL1_13330 [Burkholderiaceae bacterium]
MKTNHLAWMKGAAAFEPGDTIDAARTKAAAHGYRPYTEGYAEFITAFSREVRSHRNRPEGERKLPAPAVVRDDAHRPGGLAAA